MDSYIHKIRAVDIHGHYGSLPRGVSSLYDAWTSGDAEIVINRANCSNIETTFVSPLEALGHQEVNTIVRANERTMNIVSECKKLRQWVVVSPLEPNTYVQAIELLESDRCIGIKIHPEEHKYSITERGWELFEFAAEHKAVVLIHSGEPNSMPEDIVDIADNFTGFTLILGHLGCGWDGDPSHQIKAIQQSKHCDVLVDTSSATSITPGLIEWAVKEVGADKICFGTDSPLYFAPMQRARIDYAEISDSDKQLILRDNAMRIFSLSKEMAAS